MKILIAALCLALICIIALEAKQSNVKAPLITRNVQGAIHIEHNGKVYLVY